MNDIKKEALIVEIFDKFVGANTMKQCLQYFRDLCSLIKLNPSNIREFYPILKNKLSKSWRAQAIFKKLDLRYNLKIYGSGGCCLNTRVLVIGGGPCGLRTAIDAQLLGAKVVIAEKRDRMSRNNVLHLWPFVIEDLRHLGAKKFFGKFGAGSIDHISIRQLQLILLKVALILGVQIIEGVCFEKLIEPDHNGQCGWRASIVPESHPLKNYEFDVLIGADGKRNTLPGFKRKEFRGKLAIAITANFINRHTKEESTVPEISGISYIYKQEFFKNLVKKYKIDLENIVYYKDSTHYFVMTAKKHSLLDRGVLKQDYAETLKLLSPDNVDNAKLCSYVVDAVEYSTEGQLTNLEFAVNHYGQPDVAVFDFTSMYAAENASQVLEKHNRKLLTCLVGDSLLEPFWPTGSGCARGFLSSLDACWGIRQWGMRQPPLQVIAERESVYRLLAQTTPKNLNADISNYTVDPTTRYVALNKNLVSTAQVLHLYRNELDEKEKLKNIADMEEPHVKQFKEETFKPVPNLQKKDKSIYDTIVDKEVLMRFFDVPDLNESLRDGKALCRIIEKYRPYILDPQRVEEASDADNVSIAVDVFDMLGIPRNIENIPSLSNLNEEEMQTYLSNIYNYFKGEIPIIPHSLDSSQYPDVVATPLDFSSFQGRYDPKKLVDRRGNKAKTTLKRKSGSQRDSSQIFSSASTLDDSLMDSQLDSRKSKIKKRNVKRSVGGTTKKDLSLLKVPTVDNLRKLFEIVRKSSQLVRNDEEQTKTIKLCQKILEAQKMFLKSEDMLSYDDDMQSKTQTNVTSGSPEIASKIKHLEDILNARVDKATEQVDIRQINKKPADLMRAIGTIDVNDWQIQRLEKEITSTKPGTSKDSKEKVPKWDKSQFAERKRKIVTQNIEDDKRFEKLDDSLKKLDNQLKHGNTLNIGERGKNKVSKLASQFVVKDNNSETPTHPAKQPTPKVISVHPQKEACHVCDDHVYLMEKVTPEDGLVLHKKCFKCSFCSVPLSIRNYMFDREGIYNFKLFCIHHYGMERGVGNVYGFEANTTKHMDVIDNIPSDVDAHDRDNTPERVEVIIGNEKLEESLPIDEDEWHNQNFGSIDESSYDENSSEDDDSSSSDLDLTESDDFDDDEEEVDELYAPSPETSYKDSSGDEEAEKDEDLSGAWGPALEERRREVAVKQPPPATPTDTEAETESTSKNSEAENSATEVSTDSEFAQDDPTPTREKLTGFNTHGTKYTKTIESSNPFIEYRKKHFDFDNFNKMKKEDYKKKTMEENLDIKTEFKPLFTTISPLAVPRPGDYLLSRTQSTSGIATKKALELKKKYLLGPQINSALQKSDSASELDSKFKEFHSNISECQKLLNPASDISPSMQAFLESASRRNAGGLLSPGATSKAPSITSEINQQASLSPAIVKSSEETNLNTSSQSSSNISPKTEKSDSTTLNEIIQKTSTDKNGMSSPVIRPDNLSKNVKPQSPVFKIDVPKIPWQNAKKSDEPSGTDIDSDSLYSIESSSDDLSNKQHTLSNISVPRVEIMKPCGEVMQLDSLMMVDGEYIGPESDDELAQQTTVKCNAPKEKEAESKPISSQPLSSSDSGNDITAFFTDNESLDWAVEGNPNDALNFNSRKPIQMTDSRKQQYKLDLDDDSEHVCGKDKEKKQISTLLDRDHSDIEFMDTGSEESLLENDDSLIVKVNDVVNTGFVEFVDIDDDAYKNDNGTNAVTEAINELCTSGIDYSDNYTQDVDNIAMKQSFNKNSDPDSSININIDTEIEYIELETKQYERFNEDSSASTFLDSFENNEPHESLCISQDNSSNNINNNETIDSNDLSEIKQKCKSPRTLRKLEEITKEKEKQKDLIYQLVMEKMSKRSERKERRCRSPAYVKESQPDNRNNGKATDIEIKKLETKKELPIVTTPISKEIKSPSLSYTTSFKLLSFNGPKPVYPNNSEAFSLPDIHQSVKEENVSHINKIKNTDKKGGKEKVADNSFDMSYNYSTGIVPGFRQLSLNDFSGKLVQHVESLRNTTSNKESTQGHGPYTNMCVSDPNFFSLDNAKKAKGREGERRKSIIKTVSDFFSRKRESPGSSYQSEDRRSKISQGLKSKSKSQEPAKSSPTEVPPPIPPLPTNYTNNEQQTKRSPESEMLGFGSSVVAKPRKRCKSLNEIRYKLGDAEQRTQRFDVLSPRYNGETQERSNMEKHSTNCSCLNKYSENLRRQCNSNSMFEYETYLQQRHEELRLQLRDLYNAGNDIDHEKESTIINEMMAIVAERQALCMSKNQKK